jgi:long-subunit fatty acid transport protein
MGSWVPWTYGVAAFAGGFAVGTYIYDNFGTEILDGIEAVVD